MKEMFQAIDGCEKAGESMVLTLLDGEELGEKALVSGGEMVWRSRKEGFFSHHAQEAVEVMGSGIVQISGRRVFCDTLGESKKLVICGGGHVSMLVIQIGLMLGMEVTVLEDRPKYADNARKAGASFVICQPFEEGLRNVEGSGDTYFVIVTRGHRYDQLCLKMIAEKEHAYIGMIGSRRRVEMVKQKLIEQGGSRQVLEQVYTPIGLDIGAETPAEIGVAIMAEIVSVKNKKKRTYGFSKELIGTVMDTRHVSEKKILVTIVDRKGSAPQGIGVKMLVLPDGNCIGTIGGGCMESEVLKMALLMIREGADKAKLYQVDLTGEEAEDEGMVCGGIVDVLLEPVS